MFKLIIAYVGRSVLRKPDWLIALVKTDHDINLITGKPRAVSRSFTLDNRRVIGLSGVMFALIIIDNH